MTADRPRLAAVLAAAGLLAACGSGTSTSASSTSGPATRSGAQGSITVFAAASLTEAFTDGEHALERSHPGFSARSSFAGSQQLVANLRSGAPADVVATADTASMQALVAAGLVDPPRTFARNRLEIAVARGNPRGITGLADLARQDVAVVLADPSVPAGRFARQALSSAHVTVAPRSNELSVKAALQKVESGDADAAIVYVTDVRAASSSVDGVAIPDVDNVVATYPVAVVTATQNRQAAQLFVDSAVSGEVQTALRARGFLPPA